MNGTTGKAIKFDRLDDAADIVETSYLLMGFMYKRIFQRNTKRNLLAQTCQSNRVANRNW
jgi:hypothetical protein